MPDQAGPWFDGSFVDCASILIAVAPAIWQRAKTEPRRPIICKATGVDIANGVSFFPLILLCLAVFSTKAVYLLLATNRLILTIAGLFSLFALLEKED